MGNCATTCPYCGVGCGVSVTRDPTEGIKVMGDGSHPANAGRLCVKGTSLAETLVREGRLLHPILSGSRVDWSRALDEVAGRMAQVREQHGPEALGFYLSGQLLTEDYYVANKLMKGFMGSANVDTNSRLCMSSAVAAYKRAFGEDVVPCDYRDLECCDLLVMVGSNAAWTHPVVYQRIAAARQANPGMQIVTIDPRRTATCDIADQHLQLAPGSDGFLFCGLLDYLYQGDFLDQDYVRQYTEGLDNALEVIGAITPARVAEATGLRPEELLAFYRLFAETDRTVTLYSQGINQSATGTDKCNAIINCHLATGRIGRPGTGPFSITGQPNAMGGREVGGLSNQLAAHMDFTPEHVDRVGRFWGATDMARSPGLSAVDLFRAAANGDIRFLWIMATNPAVSLPDTALVRRALSRCEFVVVSDCTANTDTAEYADLLLPAAPWGEKDGTVTNSERCISRQRPPLLPMGEARADWWIVSQVAHRLGFEAAFPYQGPVDIFREHAALSAFENQGDRLFNIGSMANIDAESYQVLEPTYWPETPAESGRPFADGRFSTASGRAHIVPVVPSLPFAEGDQASPLLLNTGRVRDQWHTMTRTGLVPGLMRHCSHFFVALNPSDAQLRGLDEGVLVELRGQGAAVRALLQTDPGVPAGQVFAPIHWNGQFSGHARVSALIPAITDPVSGQPQSKFAAVRLQPLEVGIWAQCFTRQAFEPEAALFWSRVTVDGGFLTLLAGGEGLREGLLDALDPGGSEIVEYSDPAFDDYRLAVIRDGSLEGAAFLNPRRTALPGQAWLSRLGSGDAGSDPRGLLSGADAGKNDCSRLVCSCWEVSENTIREAMASGIDGVEALGAALRCGTQCGSCIPELGQLVAQERGERAA